MYIYHSFCIHSSVEGHLDSFKLLAIISKAAMNIVEDLSLLYMPKSGITRSSDSTMSNFLRNCQTEKHVAVRHAELVVATRISQTPGQLEALRTPMDKF